MGAERTWFVMLGGQHREDGDQLFEQLVANFRVMLFNAGYDASEVEATWDAKVGSRIATKATPLQALADLPDYYDALRALPHVGPATTEKLIRNYPHPNDLYMALVNNRVEMPEDVLGALRDGFGLAG